MRILHTSDWHIGQKLHGYDRDEEHRLFFNWLLEIIDDQKIDALLVAGDIFDVGFPSNSALKLYYTFLTQLVQSHCKDVIITGGNHDYISTLEAPSQVLSTLNIHIVGGAKEQLEEEIIKLEKGDNTCIVAAVPFLRDKDIRQINAGESYEDTVTAINKGIIRHYQQIAEKAVQYNAPSIAMGHLYVQGAGLSDSERDIHIGNLAGLNVSSFPDAFDYVALGHIHRPQKLNKTGTIRYSGSPIALSFSERKDNKQVIVIDVDKDVKSIETVEVPSFRRLISLKGNFQEIESQLDSYLGNSTLCDWAEVTIEEYAMDTNMRSRFEQLIDEINAKDNYLQIVKPILKFIGENGSEWGTKDVSLEDLSVKEVFDQLLDNKQAEYKEVLKQTFTELLDEVYHQTES